MNLWVLLVVIWIVGVATFESHAFYIKHYRPLTWARRQEGMVAFSNQVLTVMRWCWPIVVVVFVLVTVVMWSLLAFDWICDRA